MGPYLVLHVWSITNQLVTFNLFSTFLLTNFSNHSLNQSSESKTKSNWIDEHIFEKRGRVDSKGAQSEWVILLVHFLLNVSHAQFQNSNLLWISCKLKPSMISSFWKPESGPVDYFTRRSEKKCGNLSSAGSRSINWDESYDWSGRLEAISRNGLYIKSIKSQLILIRS